MRTNPVYGTETDSPCLSICVARLKATGGEHFAVWVVKAPYPGGYVHHDASLPDELTQTWQTWQQLFSSYQPVAAVKEMPFAINYQPQEAPDRSSFSSRLMQQLGHSLWKWLFDGTIQNSFAQSRGIAIGQDKPLRIRLEIRDPDLIALPWEIMQPLAGQPVISLNQQLLFSRTTSDVDPLFSRVGDRHLNILLVIGQDAEISNTSSPYRLQLEKEAATLAQILEESGQTDTTGDPALNAVPTQVDILLQPTPAELIERLETGNYNIMFYAGHGVPAPDGGKLFLRADSSLSGTELAQILVACRVKLAVFNACWGAQSDLHDGLSVPRSSLAEVLIHHGVPAVLAMRDRIADREALSFIQAFARALAQRLPIDRAVAVARQHLLTLYKFNQPAWTLPVLYLHPEFDGELIQPLDEVSTELPANSLTGIRQSTTVAYLRLMEAPGKIWPIRGGLMRVGRLSENDVMIQERWVSQRHAEILCRETNGDGTGETNYFLRDFSRYGTLILGADGWQKVHHQEVHLRSPMQIKFGSSYGQSLEFVIEANQPSTES